MRGRSTPGKCPTGALLEEMAAYASATFWLRGAIRAGVAGAVGLLAVGAWLIGIPLLSGVLVLIGGFSSSMDLCRPSASTMSGSLLAALDIGAGVTVIG